ncbi:MAG: hypothetical protein R2711_12555 [Acidimicrobiales bacterium]
MPYTYPPTISFAEVGVTGIFLGYYLPWDGWGNQVIAQAHGFETYPHFVEGSLVNYENLDNAFHGIHDYFKFIKYGFGRATDLACMAVRRERLRRDDAVELVRIHDGRFPSSYLGVSLDEMLDDLDLTADEFQAICDRFTNKRLFDDRQRRACAHRHWATSPAINYDNVAEG